MLALGEFSQFVGPDLSVFDGRLYLEAGERLWSLASDGRLTDHGAEAGAAGFRVVDGVLWRLLVDEDGEYLDPVPLNGAQDTLRGELASGTACGGRIAYVQSGEQQVLRVATRGGEVLFETELPDTADFVCDGDGIVVKVPRHGLVIAFDNELGERWRFESRKRLSFQAWPQLSLHGGTVAINLGGNPASNGEGELVGLDRASGKVRWSRVFDRLIRTHASEDRLFAAVGRELLALDPSSGEVKARTDLHDEPAGPSDVLGAHSGRLLHVNRTSGNASLFDAATLEVIASESLPPEYEVSEGAVPCAFRDRWYFPLIRREMPMKGASYGLCEISDVRGVDRSPPGFFARPKTVVEVVKRGKGEAYRLSIDTSDVRCMREFVPILVREIAQTYGHGVWDPPRRNPRFGGLIEVQITPAQESMIEDVKSWLAATEDELRGLQRWAGDGKTPIKLVAVASSR